MTQLLLSKGATINAFDKKDRRAIHWAAFMGHVDVVRLLIDFGAEINCRDKQVGIDSGVIPRIGVDVATITLLDPNQKKTSLLCKFCASTF